MNILLIHPSYINSGGTRIHICDMPIDAGNFTAIPGIARNGFVNVMKTVELEKLYENNQN